MIIEIKEEFIKLDSLLKYANIVSSGGMAKNMILDGAVLLNGVPCLQRGKKIRPGDKVQYEDLVVEVKRI